SSVIELVRPEPTSLLCEPARDVIVIFRILVWLFRHRLYLCTKRTEQMHFFRRLIIWNDNNGAIPSGAPDHGKTDTSVTGGSLHVNTAVSTVEQPLRGVLDEFRTAPRRKRKCAGRTDSVLEGCPANELHKDYRD